jgi:predicted metal-dependent hydrolase
VKVAEQITLGDIRIEVEYRRIKNIRLTVYPPEGRVHISAPLSTNPEFIRNFAASKLQWIEKHRTQYRNRSRTDGNFRNQAIQYVWGTAFELELFERKGHPKIVIEGGRMRMYVRPDSTRAKKQELLDKWYRRILRETVPGLIKKWEPLIGVTVTGFYVRKMKSHWGSCNYNRQTLRLNSELAKRSPECLEYVIVHEMTHMIEPTHNRNFYRLMNAFMPTWRAIRKKMNTGEL